MARLTITLDVDDDELRQEDPHDVAEEILDDHDDSGNRLDWPYVRPYAGTAVKFVGAEWEERRWEIVDHDGQVVERWDHEPSSLERMGLRAAGWTWRFAS